MVRDRKMQTVLRTNQIVEFVTVPAWKKNKRINLTWEHIHVIEKEQYNGYYRYLPLSLTTSSKFLALVASFTVIVCHLMYKQVLAFVF